MGAKGKGRLVVRKYFPCKSKRITGMRLKFETKRKGLASTHDQARRSANKLT